MRHVDHSLLLTVRKHQAGIHVFDSPSTYTVWRGPSKLHTALKWDTLQSAPLKQQLPLLKESQNIHCGAIYKIIPQELPAGPTGGLF